MLQHTESIDNSDTIGVRCDTGLPDDQIVYRTFLPGCPEGPFASREEQIEYETWLSEITAEHERYRDHDADMQADYEAWLQEQAERIEAEMALFEAGVALDIREALGSKSDGPQAA